jgi:hypothetical protein
MIDVSGLYGSEIKLQNTAAERRKKIARGEQSEPRVGVKATWSPGGAKVLLAFYLSPFQGSLILSHYPGFALLTPGYSLAPRWGAKWIISRDVRGLDVHADYPIPIRYKEVALDSQAEPTFHRLLY